MQKGFHRIAAAWVCLALAGLACSAVSGASSPSGSGSTGAGGSAGSATAAPAPTTAVSSSALLTDDFSDDTSGWGTGSDANKSVQYTNNALEFQVFKTNDFVYSTPSTDDYQDVHVEVTVQPNSSDANTAFGILCDQQVTDVAFHYFAITPNGQYAIARSAVAKDDVFLTDVNNAWPKSKLVPQNASTYTIGADCASGKLTLYVNGQQVASVSDPTYSKGHVGLFAWSDKKPNSVNVDFQDFKVTSLK